MWRSRATDHCERRSRVAIVWTAAVFVLVLFSSALAQQADAYTPARTATTSSTGSTYPYDVAIESSLLTARQAAGDAFTAVSDHQRIVGTTGHLSRCVTGFVAAETANTAASTAAGDVAESCLNSFTGDTLVTLADGTKKPIKAIKVGDRVLATDPETGQTKAEPVMQLIRHSGKHTMMLISLADGSMLDSTDGHPIWDATTGQFTDASKLHAGDELETTRGTLLKITGLTTYSANLTAYNLQINQIHTYYAGNTPVLVHNSCGPLTTSQATQMAERVGYRATNQTLRGQRVFTNGRNYIVQDIDSHSGGLWKMADTIRGLGSKTTRTGTYDYDLNYIGP